MELLNHIFFINLDYRTDRLKEILNELDDKQLKAERVPGILHPTGCTLAHILALDVARLRDLPYVLILEDDFKFDVSQNELRFLMNHFNIVTEQWDVLMLGAHVQEAEAVDNLLVRVIEACGAHGYLVNGHYINKLIDNLKEGRDLLQKTGEHWNYMNDQYWKKLQKEDKWFSFKPAVGSQRPSYSDLAHRYVDYN